MLLRIEELWDLYLKDGKWDDFANYCSSNLTPQVGKHLSGY